MVGIDAPSFMIIEECIIIIICVFCYLSIYWQTRKLKNSIPKDEEEGGGTELFNKIQKETRRMVKETQSQFFKMVSVIFICWLLVFTPEMIMEIIDYDYKLYPNWHLVTGLIYWINSLVNPLVYGLMNQKYKKAMYEQLPNIFTKKSTPSSVAGIEMTTLNKDDTNAM